MVDERKGETAGVRVESGVKAEGLVSEGAEIHAPACLGEMMRSKWV